MSQLIAGAMTCGDVVRELARTCLSVRADATAACLTCAPYYNLSRIAPLLQARSSSFSGSIKGLLKGLFRVLYAAAGAL